MGREKWFSEGILGAGFLALSWIFWGFFLWKEYTGERMLQSRLESWQSVSPDELRENPPAGFVCSLDHSRWIGEDWVPCQEKGQILRHSGGYYLCVDSLCGIRIWSSVPGKAGLISSRWFRISWLPDTQTWKISVRRERVALVVVVLWILGFGGFFLARHRLSFHVRRMFLAQGLFFWVGLFFWLRSSALSEPDWYSVSLWSPVPLVLLMVMGGFFLLLLLFPVEFVSWRWLHAGMSGFSLYLMLELVFHNLKLPAATGLFFAGVDQYWLLLLLLGFAGIFLYGWGAITRVWSVLIWIGGVLLGIAGYILAVPRVEGDFLLQVAGVTGALAGGWWFFRQKDSVSFFRFPLGWMHFVTLTLTVPVYVNVRTHLEDTLQILVEDIGAFRNPEVEFWIRWKVIPALDSLIHDTSTRRFAPWMDEELALAVQRVIWLSNPGFAVADVSVRRTFQDPPDQEVGFEILASSPYPLWWRFSETSLRNQYWLWIPDPRQGWWQIQIWTYVEGLRARYWMDWLGVIPVHRLQIGIYRDNALRTGIRVEGLPRTLAETEPPFSGLFAISPERYRYRVLLRIPEPWTSVGTWYLLFLVLVGMVRLFLLRQVSPPSSHSIPVFSIREVIVRWIRMRMAYGLFPVAVLLAGLLYFLTIQIPLLRQALVHHLEQLQLQMQIVGEDHLYQIPTLESEIFLYRVRDGALFFASAREMVLKGEVPTRVPYTAWEELQQYPLRTELSGYQGFPPRWVGYALTYCSPTQMCILRVEPVLFAGYLIEGIVQIILVCFLLIALSQFLLARLAQQISRMILTPVQWISARIREYQGKETPFPPGSGRLPRELQEIYTALQQMSMRISALLEQQRHVERIRGWQEVARQVSHEISNALTPLKLKLQKMMYVYSDEAVYSAVKQDLQSLLHLVQHLETLSQSFRQFSQMPRIQPREFLLSQWLQDWWNTLEFPSHIQGNLEISPHLQQVRVFLDPTALRIALTNLWKNSVEAIPPTRKGTITVRATPDPETPHGICLEVEDTGEGIPPELLSRIFLPAFTTKSGGMGVGLALVKQVVEAMDGTIEINSHVGRGTRIRLRFPRAIR